MTRNALAGIAALIAAAVTGCASSSDATPTLIRTTPTSNAIYTLTCANWLNARAAAQESDLEPLYDAFVHDLLANPGLVQPGAAIQGPVHAALDAATIPVARRFVTDKVCGTQFGSANLAATVFTFFIQAPTLPPGIVAGRE